MPNVSPVDYDPFDANALISALPNPGIAPPNPWIADPAKAEIAAANASARNWQTLPTDDWERQRALVHQEPMGIGKIADALIGTAQAPARGIAAGVGNMLDLPNTPEFQSWAGLAVPQTQDDATRTMLGQYVAGQGLNTAANVAVPSMAVERPAGSIGMGGKITAYHGTPHDFDQFDIGKIGTGEGAQVYGHGLYFAENPGVAQSYKHAGQPAFLGATPARHVNNALLEAQQAGLTGQDAKTFAIDYINNQAKNAPPMVRQEFYDAVNNFDALAGNNQIGHLYQVEINADPSHFLDWDKPLSEQHPVVQGKFGTAAKAYFDQIQAQKIDQHRQMGANSPWASEAEATAGFKPPDTVEKFQNQAGAPKAAALLRAAGIPGIRYLDQGSRTTARPIYKGDPAFIHAAKSFKEVGASPEQALAGIKDAYKGQSAQDMQAAINEAYDIPAPQTRNYVLFNDKLVGITHKNGVKVTPIEHDPFAVEKADGGAVLGFPTRAKLTEVDYDPFAEAA